MKPIEFDEDGRFMQNNKKIKCKTQNQKNYMYYLTALGVLVE